jgi:hypothetical protein
MPIGTAVQLYDSWGHIFSLIPAFVPVQSYDEQARSIQDNVPRQFVED